jgi:hypothetical protein
MPEWQTLEPPVFSMYRAYIRMILAALDFMRAGVDAGKQTMSEADRARLDDAEDRLDELVDTFSWAADAGEELPQLVREAKCG